MEEALKKEIRWLKDHRDYFLTPSCADSVINRLQRVVDDNWVPNESEGLDG